MASYNKSFNFRNGVQVDTDNFIVNANGLVGIGTSVPTEFLDVRGNTKVSGLVTTSNLGVTGTSNFYNNVTVGSAITFQPSTGAVRATTFFGSAAGLTGIYAIAVDGWYVDSAQGSISTDFNVGIGTTISFYPLQVGKDPYLEDGFSVVDLLGNVKTTGIITAFGFSGDGSDISNLNASSIASGTLNNSRLSQDINVSGTITAYSFSGFGTDLQGINASNITNGTLNNSRLPQNINISGIITANSGIVTSLLVRNGITTLGFATVSQLYVSGVTTSVGGFVGNVTGIASTARTLTGSPNITVSNITSSNINNPTGIITSLNINSTGHATFNTVSAGIVTASTRVVATRIGVGTNLPSNDIHIRQSSAATLQVTSDTNEAIVAVGRSITFSQMGGSLKFGNVAGIYPYSTQKSLDVINYDTGSLNCYLHYGPAGLGTGNFNWIYAKNASSPLMSLTYGGNLGIGVTNPGTKLQVSGIASVSSLNVDGSITATGTGSSTSVDTLYVYGGKTQILNSDGTSMFSIGDQNVNITSGISTFYDINVTNFGIFSNRIGVGNTNPLGEIHIGDYENDLSNSILITSSGIGIGTDDLSSSDAAFYCLSNDAIFGAIGIGTTAVGDNGFTFRSVGNANVAGSTTITGNLNVTGTGIVTTRTLNDGIGNVRSYPQNSRSTSASAYTLTSSDVGKHVLITDTTNGIIVPDNVFSAGQYVILVNNTTNQCAIDDAGGPSAAVVRVAGNSSTTLPQYLETYGVATLLCVASNTFVLYGQGVIP